MKQIKGLQNPGEKVVHSIAKIRQFVTSLTPLAPYFRKYENLIVNQTSYAIYPMNFIVNEVIYSDTGISPFFIALYESYADIYFRFVGDSYELIYDEKTNPMKKVYTHELLQNYPEWLIQFADFYQKVPNKKLNEERFEAVQQYIIDFLIKMRRKTAFDVCIAKMEKRKQLEIMSWKRISKSAHYPCLKASYKSPKIIFFGYCNFEPEGLLITGPNENYREIKSKFNFKQTLRRLASVPKLAQYVHCTLSGGVIICDAKSNEEIIYYLKQQLDVNYSNITSNEFDELIYESPKVLHICHVNCNNCRIFTNNVLFPHRLYNTNLIVKKVDSYSKIENDIDKWLTSKCNDFLSIKKWYALKNLLIFRKLKKIKFNEMRLNKLEERIESQQSFVDKLKLKKKRGDMPYKYAILKLHRMKQKQEELKSHLMELD